MSSKLVTLIVSTVKSVSTLGHSTVLKEGYHPDKPTLKSWCFEESNIQELKARLLLRELAPNFINRSVDLLPNQRGLPSKKNVQRLLYKIILNLNI